MNEYDRISNNEMFKENRIGIKNFNGNDQFVDLNNLNKNDQELKPLPLTTENLKTLSYEMKQIQLNKEFNREDDLQINELKTRSVKSFNETPIKKSPSITQEIGKAFNQKGLTPKKIIQKSNEISLDKNKLNERINSKKSELSNKSSEKNKYEINQENQFIEMNRESNQINQNEFLNDMEIPEVEESETNFSSAKKSIREYVFKLKP
jgi:hypothetical protein